ncbi:MAG: threonine/serine dehydratase [Proteobacteria bacterium]|nr:threonine/serine dehydratase [Pseudomonadota bacterium]
MAGAALQLSAIRKLQKSLRSRLVHTPVVRCPGLEEHYGGDTEIYAKLEFLQHTGTFKARGALATLSRLGKDQLAAGVTAVSAGNHAIAVAFAAAALGTSAKVVMMRAANSFRVERCQYFGAEVVFADDVHSAFRLAESIQAKEGRFFVHPFEGLEIVLGTATVGAEICAQVDGFDAILVPVGGGGLCAGIASAVKQLNPLCDVFGVEPAGADTMHRSFRSGKPEAIDQVSTIADSLGAPFALPLSFGLCRDNVDELVMVDDEQLRAAMGILFRDMRIAVEPACAATTAALLGPLCDRFRKKRVVLVLCGSNIDWQTFAQQAQLKTQHAA